MPTVSGRLLTLVVLVTATHFQVTHAQNRYEWTVYSALNAVQSIAFDDAGTIWAATTGGIFGYHPAQDSFEIYRTTDGLMTLNTTAIGIDPGSGKLYAGAADGSISIRSSDGDWRGITDITGADIPDRRINDFRFHGGRVYVLTAFGVAVFNPANETFAETWTRFRDFAPNTPVNDVLFWRDSIFVATDRGIARASESGVLLPNPLSWTIISGPGTGMIGDRVLGLAVLDDRLIASSDSGIFTRDDAGMFTRRGELTNREPIRLATRSGHIVASTYFTIFRAISGQFTSTELSSPVVVRDLAVSSDGTAAIAADNLGLGYIDDGALRIVVPSAPVSNYFSDIALGADGSIWTSSIDFGGNGRGVSRLKNDRWEQYTVARYPQARSNVVQNVGLGGDGSIWAGTFGSGVLRLTPGDTGAIVERFDHTNSPLRGVKDPNDPAQSYVIVGDAAGDLRGRTWMLNWDNTGGNGPMLVVRLTAEEASQHGSDFVGYLRPPIVSERNFRWIVIDQNGTKWLGSDQPGSTTGVGPNGLTFFVDGGTLTTEGDDTWDRLTTAYGLVSNQQTALAVDLDGAIWIGAPNGLSVLDNPMTVASQGAETARIRNSDREPGNCCRALRDVSVSALAVDALNRKWVGTNQGIFVLSPDGIDVVARFTVENSPLVDNDVLALLAVPATGDMFVGTSNGLNRVSTEAVESPSPADDVTLWPQPFLVPSDEPVRIAGLPTNAKVKILTTSGRIVAQFDSPGGAVAFWNGLDNDGAPVPTGVYIVAAGASSGDETVVGKIAVIRR